MTQILLLTIHYIQISNTSDTIYITKPLYELYKCISFFTSPLVVNLVPIR